MAECAARFRSRANADSIGALLHPGTENERQAALRRKGRPARDHARENVLAIRRAERENRQRKEEAANAVKKPYKMKQFRNVASRAVQQAETWENPTLSPREDATYLKRGAGRRNPKPAEVHKQRQDQVPKLQFLNMSPRAPEERTPRKAPLPKTRGEIKHHKPVDRIEQNRIEAQKPLPPKPKARVTKVAKASPRKHENFGHVPAYLDQRKRQLRAEAEAKKALLPDPQCPEGMTRMPDEERVGSLNDLQRRKAEIKAELFKLPLNVNSMRARKHQEALHKALDDVENSIKIFERPVVYIQA